MHANHTAIRFAALLSVLMLGAGAVSAQLSNRSEPLPGITSSGQPDAAALEAIAEEGYVAVIDLRGEQENRGIEEQSLVEALGMRYVSLPIAGTDAVSYENAGALDAILEQIDGPVLLHCASGNRVGGILALREHLNGASAKDAFKLGVTAGMSSPALREAVETRLNEL